MSLIEEGQEIARKLGGEVIYKGPWLPDGEKGEFYGHWFTDRVTGSSFAAKTLEEAKAILIQSRKDWGEKPPVFANNPTVEVNKMKEEKISPAVVVGGLGLGLVALLGLAALAWAAPKGLQEGGNTVKWTLGPTMVEDALADIIDYVEIFYVLRADGVWIQITAWETWAIPRDQICGIVVDRACPMPEGFVWA